MLSWTGKSLKLSKEHKDQTALQNVETGQDEAFQCQDMLYNAHSRCSLASDSSRRRSSITACLYLSSALSSVCLDLDPSPSGPCNCCQAAARLCSMRKRASTSARMSGDYQETFTVCSSLEINDEYRRGLTYRSSGLPRQCHNCNATPGRAGAPRQGRLAGCSIALTDRNLATQP